MFELSAATAREILNDRDKWNSEAWWREYKHVLFNKVKHASLSGCNHLSISDMCWRGEESNRDYMREQLIKLDYDVKLTTLNGHEEMIISW